MVNGKTFIIGQDEVIQIVNNHIENLVYEQLYEVVGYRIQRNGKVFSIEGWFTQDQMFKTKEDLFRWLNIYGYGSGIDNTNQISVQEVKLIDLADVLATDKTIEKLYIHVSNYTDDITEYCPYCGEEVTIHATFANQVCSSCGQLISPCSLCDCGMCDCENCPLQKMLFTN
jgi:NADH pyrophosphatase NudC (nudix superfamily)